MKRFIKKFFGNKIVSILVDIIMLPVTILGSLWFRFAKFLELKRLPLSRTILLKVGVHPLVSHYYEPLFDFRRFPYSNNARKLPGVSLNEKGQLALMEQMDFANELSKFSMTDKGDGNYFYNNGSYPSGDSELYYSLIRLLQPNRVIEIGSGFSTRIAVAAINQNKKLCSITCIEPYEMSWLERMSVQLLRKKVEEVDIQLFKGLKENDILFVDSSHVIRPDGDVLFEILEILPILNAGVYVHFHDVFTPFEYPLTWLRDDVRLWNEQYLLEAFLSENNSFEVVASTAFLNAFHRDIFKNRFPIIYEQEDRKPGSLWIKKVK